MKKKVIGFIVGFLMIATGAIAQTVTGTWDHDGDCEGFKVYDQDNIVVADVDSTVRSVDLEVPKGCWSFYVTAYSGDEESQISNVDSICVKPGKPGGWKLSK